MKKFLGMAAALSGLLLAACGQAAEEPAYTPATTEEADTTATTDDTVASDVVVLYSNALSDGRGDWIAEHALAEIGIELQMVDGGGVYLANRILAEQAAPIADVVFGLNQILWQSLVNEGAITPYVPVWADEVDASLNNPDGYFHAVALVVNLLAYDLGQMDPADAPADWTDLWNDERFIGTYALPQGLGGSTIQMVLSGIFNRYLDENGDMGLSEEGWAQIAAKFANGVPTDQDLFAEWVNETNDVVASQIWHMGIAPREAQFDIQAGIVVPEIGVPVSVEGVALINGANNPEAAQRFMDWFGSADVMNRFGYAFDYLPANPNALEGLPEFTLMMAELPRQDINWPVISSHMAQWIERIYLNYMQ